MRRRLKAFGAFWYDFVIGDDWRVALGVAGGLGLTYLLAHQGYHHTWWLILVAIGLLLPISIRRVTRKTPAHPEE